MKVYYIFNTETNEVITSNTYKSGIYTSLVSVAFAFSQVSGSWRNKGKFVIKSAYLTNVEVVAQ